MKDFFKKHWKVGIAILLAAMVSLYVIWELPYSLRIHDKKGYRKNNDAPASVMIDIYFKHHEMINAKRAAVIQVVGGVLFIIALSFAYKRAKALEDGVKASLKQVNAQKEQNDEIRKSNRETLTLEQYTRAIDQLGNDNIAVRLGGIYSLEQIMNSEKEQDSEYHDQIIELLAAYVRGLTTIIGNDSNTRLVVQSIISVLGRREIKDNEVRINLSNSNLTEYDLHEAHLEDANFSDTHLDGANFFGAHLEGASFGGAHLEGANLRKSHLEKANMSVAKLEKANLGGAHLEGAVLWNANLKYAFFNGAHLDDANLSGSNMMGIIIESLQSGKDKARIDFIEELEKAKYVSCIKLDHEIMDIIKKDFPKLWKRIKGNKQDNEDNE